MYSQQASYYDKIYSFKDYRAEVEKLLTIIQEHLPSGGKRLLDVACGTGSHLVFLKEHFMVEGLDISPELLEIARQKLPDVTFNQGDMTGFDLERTFDIVTCLFSSIGYVMTLGNVAKAVHCMVNHLVPGGLLIIEPWFPPDQWHPNTVHGIYIDESDLKVARINTSSVDGRISMFDLHHLVGTPAGVEYFVEHHELGLFETEEMRMVLENGGLKVSYDAEGFGRGLFIATKF